MSIQITDNIVKIDFEMFHENYAFRDAIILSLDVYNTLTAADIESMKQQRFNTWVEIITAPPPIEVISTETQV